VKVKLVYIVGQGGNIKTSYMLYNPNKLSLAEDSLNINGGSYHKFLLIYSNISEVNKTY
jgi:hypothetical protein